MKINPFLLSLLCIVFISLSSCKTDPKVEPDTPQITKESTVNIRLRAEPDRLNPMLTTRGYSLQVCEKIFPTILNYDPFTFELKPQLVKSRPITKKITEGELKGWTTYTYEFLDEAVWDDGSPVTGHDYLFTLKTLFNPHVGSAPYRSYLDLIKKIEVDANNPKKFVVYTDEYYIKAEFATGQFVYPQYKYDPDKVMDAYEYSDLHNPDMEEQFQEDEILKAFGEKFNSPDFSRNKDFIESCGAYKLEEWVEGERVVLVKKDNWWGDKVTDKIPTLTANPKRLVYKPVADATTALTLMKNLEIDVAARLPEGQFKEFRASEIGKKHYNFHTPQSFGYGYLGLNSKRPKLADKRVRQALAYVLDIDEILKTVKEGFAEKIIGPFHPIRPYYHTDLEPKTLDIEKAKKLLADAGWEDTNGNGTVDKNIDGELMELELDVLITPSNNTSTGISLILQDGAKKAGIKINIVERDVSTIFGMFRSRDFDIFSLASVAELSIDDPFQFWHTSSDVPNGGNRFGFGNAETDKLIEDIRSEMDEPKRNAMFKKLQEIIYEEQPAIFLYASKDRIVVNKKFKGVQTTIKSPGFFVNYWYE